MKENETAIFTDAITKREQLLRYIEALKPGSKISVRKMAKQLDVSEGTAYRAIKEAEKTGIVTTKERIGTVRIEKRARTIEHLSYSEVVRIVDGRVLGGAQGLEKPLEKFVIGAMLLEDMTRYIEAGSLLIVGNRYRAHLRALQQGAGVLITGGFDASDEAKRLADALALPVISCGYDTFTVASMINRAMYDRMIRRKIVLVEDILPQKQPVIGLKSNHTVEDWRRLYSETGHNRFPVTDEWNRVIGVITAKDVSGAAAEQSVDKLMTRNPIMVNMSTSIASAAHIMVWEGIELLPVVDMNRKLLGVISRQDVLEAMQYTNYAPQSGETIEDLVLSEFEEVRDEAGLISFRGFVTPQMTNHLGTLAEGVLTTLIMKAAYRAVKDIKKGDLVLENISMYFLRPVQLEAAIEIRPRIIEVSRKHGKVDVEVLYDGTSAAKAMLAAQIIDHPG